MDQNETSLEFVDTDAPETDESFAKEMAKVLAINVVATVGVFAGMAAVGFVATKVRERQLSKRAKKALSETTEKSSES